jgi:hypothetical protein
MEKVIGGEIKTVHTVLPKMKLVKTFWDLITVDLYGCEERYHVNYQKYWIKSMRTGELEEHEIIENFQNWKYFEEYVEHEMIYIAEWQ